MVNDKIQSVFPLVSWLYDMLCKIHTVEQVDTLLDTACSLGPPHLPPITATYTADTQSHTVHNDLKKQCPHCYSYFGIFPIIANVNACVGDEVLTPKANAIVK